MYDVNVEYNKEKCELSFLNMKARVAQTMQFF